jgi:hypothetical protein
MAVRKKEQKRGGPGQGASTGVTAPRYVKTTINLSPEQERVLRAAYESSASESTGEKRTPFGRWIAERAMGAPASTGRPVSVKGYPTTFQGDDEFGTGADFARRVVAAAEKGAYEAVRVSMGDIAVAFEGRIKELSDRIEMLTDLLEDISGRRA